MNDLERLVKQKQRESLIKEENELTSTIENDLIANELDLDNLNLLTQQIPVNTLTSIVEHSFRNDYKLDNVLKNMNRNKPFLLITAGTTGSGKSNFKRRIVDTLLSTVEISIDDIIENDNQYKNMIIDIILQYDLYLGPEKDRGLPGRLNNVELLESDDVIHAFNEAYFSVKEKVQDERIHNLRTAIKDKKNIIIETTGKSIPFKYLNMFEDYNIIFLYILVPNNELRSNNITRAENKILSFMSDVDANPAPRLTNINNINIVKKNEDMLNILNEIRKICSGEYEICDEKCKEICDTNNISLVIYNNNRKLSTPLLVYNHITDNNYTEEYFKYIVNNILYPSTRSRIYKKSARRVKSLGGKRKKRTHKKKNKNKSKKNLKKTKDKNNKSKKGK